MGSPGQTFGNHRIIMDEAFIKTPLGMAHLQGNGLGIQSISVLGDPGLETESIPGDLIDAVKQLQEYFAGDRKEFYLKLNPAGTDFQKAVWQALIEIPFGKTISYMDLSKQLGNIKAIRAVAAANGKNPIWIVIPCHRVIGSDGSLTGYAGGLHRKKWLLDHESPNQQQSLF